MEKIPQKQKPAQLYLKDKQEKKKIAMTGVWFLLAFGIIFITLVVKFAIAGSTSDLLTFSAYPGSEDVYQVAKQFVSPTIRSHNLIYADDHYQFAKKSDSLFVIKSFVNAINDKGDKVQTNFRITLKYNGGAKLAHENWTLVDLNSDNN